MPMDYTSDIKTQRGMSPSLGEQTPGMDATREVRDIEIGYEVFLGDGAAAFGGVRRVMPGGRPVLLVNVEGAGDVHIPLAAVEKVVEKRVVVRWEALEPD